MSFCTFTLPILSLILLRGASERLGEAELPAKANPQQEAISSNLSTSATGWSPAVLL